MAQTFYFNNKKVTLPGVYSTIVSGESNATRTLDYGKVLIIDTGALSYAQLASGGAGTYFGGGAGIEGELASGAEAIYRFTTIDEFKQFVKGSMYYTLADALWYPDPNNSEAVGISELYFVRAAKTTASTMTFKPTGGGANGGTFIIKTRDEGVGANGVVQDSNLVTGFGFMVTKGVDDSSKFILSIYGGTFTGIYTDGIAFNGVKAINSAPRLYCQSPEFNNVQELIDWATTSSDFNNHFALGAGSVVTGTGAVTATDLENYSAWVEAGQNLAQGGTIVYDAYDANGEFDTDQADNVTYLNEVLEQVIDLDYNSVICDQNGAYANGAATKAIIQHNNLVAKFKHFVWVGAYADKSDFTKSLTLAKGFDNCYVQCVHDGAGLASTSVGEGYRWFGVMYTLASMVGRLSGKPPYVPLTGKTLGIDKLKHVLSEPEQEKAIKAGLIVPIYDANIANFKVLLDCNTLQDNEILFNQQGESFSIQFMRIVTQLNRELVVNATLDLLNDENGVNRNTLRAGTVQNWTISFLQSRVATLDQDNLILGFQNVNTIVKGTSYWTSYEIRVNNEIYQLFFTGYLIN